MSPAGPCQLPTLWFCVHRHDSIATFVPRPYWTLQARVVLPLPAPEPGALGPAGAQSVELACAASAGPIWSAHEATQLLARVRGSTGDGAGGDGPRCVAVGDATVRVAAEQRPLPLNTLAMLREASLRLGIGPGDAMHHAERLYLSGHISYPRTETCRYAAGFDLAATLTAIASAVSWLPEAARLVAALEPTRMQEQLHARARQDGVNAGDHPPITPVKLKTRAAGAGDERGDGGAEWALYELICRHFVASLSDDALFETAGALVAVGGGGGGGGGGVHFALSATRCARRGWMEVLGLSVDPDSDPGPEPEPSFSLSPGDGGASGGRMEGAGAQQRRDGTAAVHADACFRAVAAVRAGCTIRLSSAPASVQSYTEPPAHLTESELLTLMEAHAIGTDASMATHVSNVIKRGYVHLDEATRRLVPAPLGLALVHAYSEIDEGLALPCVRASIEAACARVARGEASFDEVVAQSLAHFKRRYVRFTKAVHALPTMLVASLAPGGGVIGADSALGNAAGFAGLARWRAAAERTASVRLDELLDMASPRVQQALRGADAQPGMPPAGRSGGAHSGTGGARWLEGTESFATRAHADADAVGDADAEAEAAAAASEAAVERAAIEEATAALAALGIVARPAQQPPAPRPGKPPPPQQQQLHQQPASPVAPEDDPAARAGRKGRRSGARKNRGKGDAAVASATQPPVSASNSMELHAGHVTQPGALQQADPPAAACRPLALNPNAAPFRPR